MIEVHYNEKYPWLLLVISRNPLNDFKVSGTLTRKNINTEMNLTTLNVRFNHVKLTTRQENNFSPRSGGIPTHPAPCFFIR
jgi:hypothetical protein